MLQAIERLAAAKPGLGVAQRASILVLASGPYHPQAREIQRVPLAGFALRGTVRGFHILLTAGPLVAIERITDAVLGTPQTSAQVNAHRWMILSGTAATMVAGLAVQRTLNHSTLGGPAVEAGRVLGTQLSIGATASAIVIATDIVLGESGRGSPNHPATALVFRGMIASAQSKALAALAGKTTLPTRP